MLSEQTPVDPLSLIIEVDLDSYGKELNNEQEYKFRLVALNTFNHSDPSKVISVTPKGKTPQRPQNVSTTCQPPDYWDKVPMLFGPVPCTEGRGYNGEATIYFRKPLDDGGMPILAYRFETSVDNGATYVDQEEVPVAALVADGTRLMQHKLVGLKTDVATKITIAAVNFYGKGVKFELGPYTPTDCPHLENCKVCKEKYFQIWGNQCAMPECVLQDKATDDLRMVECTGTKQITQLLLTAFTALMTRKTTEQTENHRYDEIGARKRLCS
jgi:hypothetical protein